MLIKERMKQVIAVGTRDRTRYVELKEKTGISGDIWKKFWFNQRQPDAYMIEALARTWPEYAYWLVTGSTDVANGHICPSSAFCFELTNKSLLTSKPFLKLGTELAQDFDNAIQSCPEEADQIFEVIHNFMAGEAVHKTMELKSFWDIDGLFKKIRTFNQARKLRDSEISMNYLQQNNSEPKN